MKSQMETSEMSLIQNLTLPTNVTSIPDIIHGITEHENQIQFLEGSMAKWVEYWKESQEDMRRNLISDMYPYNCVIILGLAASIPTLMAMVLLVALIVVCAQKRRKDGHSQENQRQNDFPDIYDSSEVSLENLSSPDMDVKETIELEETHVYVKTIMGTEELSYDAYFPKTEMEKKQSLPRWLLPKRDRK